MISFLGSSLSPAVRSRLFFSYGYFLSLVLYIFSFYLIEYDFNLFLIVVVFFVGRILLSGRMDSVQIVFYLVAILLYVIPSIAIFYLRGIDVSYIAAAFFVFTELLNFILKKFIFKSYKKRIYLASFQSRYGNDVFDCLFVVILSLVYFGGLIFPDKGFLSYLSFLFPFALSLFLFERCLRHSNSIVKIWIYFFLICGSILFYALFYWSGFGRLLIGAYILLPVLLLNQYLDFGLRFWKILTIVPFLLYFAQFTRYGTEISVDQIFIGSAGHHLLVTHDLFTLSFVDFDQGLDRFFDQLKLFFLNWFPRDLWIDKPVGAGLSSVDDLYGRNGFGDEYSQSLGFVGEQIYLLGDLYIVGLLTLLLVIVLVYRFIFHMSAGYTVTTHIWTVSLISFYWGGMATFGSRVWFLLIPCLILSLLSAGATRSRETLKV
ncbi:hypothetical protein [Limnobacter sp.]|uniref:hypothetical protein n=1 Tax=Limnobacter sp. TaxID=2003368 RepID=UPI0025BA1C15|nr:hypothetical protein [Limnobacter sp.]